MSTSKAIPPSWILVVGERRRSLKAQNKAESTIRIYTSAVRGLGRWVVAQGFDLPLQQVERRHIEGFIVDVLERTSAGNARTQNRLCVPFGWLLDEEEIDASPMVRMKPPYVPEKSVPIVPDDLTRRVLDGCRGRSLVSRRDAAIVRLLADTGCRLAEIADLTLGDVVLTLDVVHVVGKGRRPRIVPFGARTGQARS